MTRMDRLAAGMLVASAGIVTRLLDVDGEIGEDTVPSISMAITTPKMPVPTAVTLKVIVTDSRFNVRISPQGGDE